MTIYYVLYQIVGVFVRSDKLNSQGNGVLVGGALGGIDGTLEVTGVAVASRASAGTYPPCQPIRFAKGRLLSLPRLVLHTQASRMEKGCPYISSRQKA